MAQEWLEVLDKRNRTSKTKRLHIDDQPTRKFSYDGQVGRSMHYLDGVGAWQDVDESAEEPDDQGFSVKFTKLSYFVRVGDDGGRRFYPDRNDLSYYIELKKPFANMGQPTRQGRWFYWDFPHAVIGIRCDVDSLKFAFRLKDDQAPTSITIPFETQGITRQGRLLLHDGEVVAELRKPIATGSNLDAEGMPVQKECDVVFAPGEVTISLDPTGLEYPIEIDPTVDKQVGASLDDAEEISGTVNVIRQDIRLYGSSGYYGGQRWTGVDIPGGATIGVAYMEIYLFDEFDDYFTGKVLYGENNNNPPAFVAEANNISDRTFTTESVALGSGGQGTGWKTLPSMVDVVQEVVDDQGGTGDAFVAIITSTTTQDLEYYQWDFDDHTYGPKLYIEYSVGAEEYSLEIGAGSYALTGATAGLPVGRVMGAVAGSYAVTGAAASLLKDLLIGAGAGSYTLTGSAVGLKRGLIITADGGSYALSGDAVSLLLDWVLSAGAGAYTVTGADAALLRTLIMAAAAGSYALTGADVAVLFGKIMAAEGGSYAIAGSDVDLLKAVILTMGGGTYVLTGQTVDLVVVTVAVVRRALHAMKRSFALTPEERSFALHAEKRSFDLTPEDEDE